MCDTTCVPADRKRAYLALLKDELRLDHVDHEHWNGLRSVREVMVQFQLLVLIQGTKLCRCLREQRKRINNITSHETEDWESLFVHTLVGFQ